MGIQVEQNRLSELKALEFNKEGKQFNTVR